MDDGKENKVMEKDISRQSFSNLFNVSTFLQSIWIRCGSVFSNITDRKFMESELRLVWYCGLVFWIIYVLSQVI
jgi:hypothetical protein